MNGAGDEESLEAVEGVLTVRAPMEDHVLPGQGMQQSGNGSEVFYIVPVVPGETQKGVDFRGVLERADLPDGGEQRGVRYEAFFGNSVAEVADLPVCEGTLVGTKLEFCVSEMLEDLAEAVKVLLSGSSEDDVVVQIKEVRFPVETGEDAVHEAGEGGGSIAEA